MTGYMRPIQFGKSII